MVAVRARVHDLLALIRADVAEDVAQAANGPSAVDSALLSRGEAAASPSALVREADARVRRQGGPGTRVTTTAATDAAMSIVEANIAAINQATGAGKVFFSQDEIRRLQGTAPETAARTARAYELITGKHVALDGAKKLPPATTAALVRVLTDQHLLPSGARVSVTDVREQDGGHAFRVQSPVFAGRAFARDVDGRVVIAPGAFSLAELQTVQDAALAFFDDEFGPHLAHFASASEIAAARAAFVPTSALLAGERDPHGLVDTHALVFRIANTSGTDHGVYVAFDPPRGAVEAYAFN